MLMQKDSCFGTSFMSQPATFTRKNACAGINFHSNNPDEVDNDQQQDQEFEPSLAPRATSWSCHDNLAPEMSPIEHAQLLLGRCRKANPFLELQMNWSTLTHTMARALESSSRP